jgi:hypothetical protein
LLGKLKGWSSKICIAYIAPGCMQNYKKSLIKIKFKFAFIFSEKNLEKNIAAVTDTLSEKEEKVLQHVMET